MRKIRYKILVTFLAIFSFFIILMGGYNIVNLIKLDKSEVSNLHTALFEDYDKMIKSEVETAVGVINSYYNLSLFNIR